MDFNLLGVDVIQALVVPLTTVFVWLAKLLAPKIPRAFLPLLATVLGVGIDLFIAWFSGGTFNPVVGATLGALGVWLREFVNTLNQHGLDS